MQKIGTGYVKYFNEKTHRTGSLFQGPFKSVHIDSNEYLLYLSAYVNLNDKIHKIEDSFGFSSLHEYIQDNKDGMCEKSIILEQFSNKKYNYEEFLNKSLQQMIETKEGNKKMEKYLLEN
jgi:putative transposase